MLIFICGKGGSGKDTLLLRTLFYNGKVNRLVLYTTRPLRRGEKDGITYHFVNNDTFDDMFNKGEILEKRSYKTVEGIWKYGTSKIVNEEDSVYITAGPYEQYKTLKSVMGENLKGVYLKTSTINCMKRMLRRSYNPKGLLESFRRAHADSIDYKKVDISDFDYVIDTNTYTISEEEHLLMKYIDSVLQRDNQV